MDLSLSDILNHLGEQRQDHYHSVAPPIFTTVNFTFPSVEDMREKLKAEYAHPFYTRGHNPTVETFNQKMAALEGTEAALSFGSGSAAVAAAVMANVGQGDHIVCVRDPYSWTNKLLNIMLPRFGVTATMVEGTPESYQAAIQPNTKLLFIESPNSFTFELQDIPGIVAVARQHGLLTVCDNSYCTPLNQQPARMGVDIVVHSATKYISGHGDAVAGVLCCSKDMHRKIFYSEFMTLGGVLSPFNAYLLLRGLRTLPLRLERVGKTAMTVASWLATQPQIAKVYYPFLPDHPQYALGQQQIKQPGGMFSIQLNTKDLSQIDAFCNRLRLFLLGASWGGYESLAFPSSTFTQQATRPDGYPLNLIRLYTGLEEPSELIADLAHALAAITE